MTIEFHCPDCGKPLRTADDKAGRQVKCPQCGSTITVPHAGAGAADPFPEDAYREGGTFEPARRAAVTRVPLEAGEVVSTSWAIFKAQMGMLIVAILITGAVSGAASVPTNVIQNLFQRGLIPQNQVPAFAIVFFGLYIISLVVQIYMGLGMTIFFLKIARGQPAQFGDLFRGGHYFWRGLGAGILFGLMVAGGFVLLIVPGVILSLIFWPYIFVLVDTDAPGIQCLSRAQEITRGTWGTVFVLFLTAFGLTFLGVLACCVGLLFTVPLASLLYAVAYCRMTGKPTASV